MRSKEIKNRSAVKDDQTAGTVPELLTTEEAAKLLGIAPQTLCVWRVSGRGVGLAYVKVGPRIVRYSRGEIIRFLKNQTMASLPPGAKPPSRVARYVKKDQAARRA